MKILSVCSARPNFVKLAAVHRAIAVAKRQDLTHVIVHTGQHYDPLLSDIFFKQLSIPHPAVNLGIAGLDRSTLIAKTREALAPVFTREKPDIVLVYGDVNGALGAAQAAHGAGIRLGHVEAGLRSGDLSMPEEHNRISIDRIAELLFCSEQSGVDHLRAEKASGRVHLVGNTMIDTLLQMLPLAQQSPLPSEARKLRMFVVATLHRPSNVDEERSLCICMEFLKDIARELPVLLPAHPRLKMSLERFGIRVPNGVLVLPLQAYVTFLHLLHRCAFILTDSGGIQEEAAILKKRCFTLRKNTERPSTIESGSNVLIDIHNHADCSTVLTFARHPAPPTIAIPPLWDGHAGARIIDVLTKEQGCENSQRDR